VVFAIELVQRDGEQRAAGGDLHASFDAAISRLSYDVVPASNTARFLVFSAMIVLPAAVVIIATKGRLGRAKEPLLT
jgi:hypothetical protein